MIEQVRQRVHWPLALCSMAALVWLLVARVAGPLDLWDQTQPKTICYTTDIVLHGNWILPIEAGERPATKPPLYNWIAAPFVWLLGFGSVIAHKMPSVISIALCWLLVVRLGNGIDRRSTGGVGQEHVPIVGWLAGLMLVSTYPMFKLGYLARPDMVLTLWIAVAWVAATAMYVRGGSQRMWWLQAVLWVSIGLAGLTKGPAALVPVIYVFLAARVIGGSWGTVNRSGWWWGLPLALVMTGTWVAAAWMIDREHVLQVLWHDEIYGRVTGTGPEGSDKGPIGFVIDLPNMGGYYLGRFAPWSVLTIIALFAMIRRHKGADADQYRERGWRLLPEAARPWLLGAVVFIVVTIGFFTLSTGKRADYLAPCYPAAAILAAWWSVHMRPRLGVKAPWLVSVAGAVILTVMTVSDQRQPAAPSPEFPRKLEQFVWEAREAIHTSPAPIAFWQGGTYFQALFGVSMREDGRVPLSFASEGTPFWLVTIRDDSLDDRIESIVASSGGELEGEIVVESADMGWPGHWPTRHLLMRFQ